MKTATELARPNIAALKPYSSARDEYQGKDARVFLDANENPYNAPLNRYPDPLQRDVKAIVSEIKGVAASRIFLGNGSDEAIDLMFRIFCEPGRDNVVAMEPTYGMYRVCADINDVEYRAVNTDGSFQPDVDAMLGCADANTKLMFFCSPNNPSGNLVRRELIIKALDNFEGIVIIDEAYTDFAPGTSMAGLIDTYPNLVILQTFSKAWGLAGVRLGMAFAQEETIGLMNRVKYPYNVNHLTQQAALEQLESADKVSGWVSAIISERGRLENRLAGLGGMTVFPSDANFLLVRMENATRVYNYLVDNGIIVRNRSRITLCGDSLRITVGTPAEDDELLKCLTEYYNR